MAQIEFEDRKQAIPLSSSRESKMEGWLMRAGLVRSRQQAAMFLITLVILGIIFIGIKINSIQPILPDPQVEAESGDPY